MNKIYKKLSFLFLTVITTTSVFLLNNSHNFSTTISSNSSSDSQSTKHTASVPNDAPELTNLCYVDYIDSGSHVENAVRIGIPRDPQSENLGHGGANFTGYNTINFVNSQQDKQFKVDTQTPVDDIHVIDFNSDTYDPFTTDTTPTWYNGTTNTLASISTVSITDLGHSNEVSPLSELGFYTFSNNARLFSYGSHSDNGQAFTGLQTVSVSDVDSNSPVVLKVVHNGAFYHSTTSGYGSAVLKTVDFGPSNQLTVFDEPTGPSPLQNFGCKYDSITGDYDSNTTNPTSGIFTNQSALTQINLHQKYYGSTNTSLNPATLLNIPANMFSGCTSLKSIQGGVDSTQYNNANVLAIPTTVQSIGSNAFKGVPANVLIMPTDIKTIGSNIFGSAGSTTLNDIIFSNPTPNDAIKNYSWNTLIADSVSKLNVYVPYDDKFNSVQDSPYYSIFSKYTRVNVMFNHATAITLSVNTNPNAYIYQGKAGATGNIDISQEPYIIKAFPLNSYILPDTGVSLASTFDAGTTNVKFSDKSSYYVHDTSKYGNFSIALTSFDYSVTKNISDDLNNITNKASVSYTNGSKFTNWTCYSNTSTPFEVMFWTAQTSGYKFSQPTDKTQWVKYTNDLTFSPINTTLNFDGTGESGPDTKLTIKPVSSNTTVLPSNFASINQTSTVTKGSGTTKGNVVTNSTLKYSKSTDTSVCNSYSVALNATLSTDSTVTATDTNSSDFYIVNVWGVQKVTYDSIDTSKTYDWNGSGNFSYSYKPLNGKSAYYNNVSPQTPSGVSYAIQNVKKDGATVSTPSCLAVDNTGVVNITNANTSNMGLGDWTFDVKITSGDDQAISTVVSYTFDATVVTGLVWTADTIAMTKDYSIDISATQTQVSLTWEATAVSSSTNDTNITYNFNLNSFTSLSATTPFTVSAGTISWGADNWNNNLCGIYEIPVTATLTPSSGSPLTITDELTFRIYKLQSVAVNSSNVSFNNMPLEVGKGAGQATNPYTFLTTYKDNSAGQPDDTALASVVWSINVNGGSVSWMHIDDTGLLFYDANYDAGDFSIIASVAVKPTANSTTTTGTASSVVVFKSWKINGMTINLNGNPQINTIDNSTSGQFQYPLLVNYDATNLPDNSVTWTLGQDITNSVSGGWAVAGAPQINNNGVIYWGQGLLVGDYYFTITATSNADSTKSCTFGSLDNVNTEFKLSVISRDYHGTTIDTFNDDPAETNFSYEVSTYDTWVLKVRDSNGDFTNDMYQNNCTFKITSNLTVPTWLTLDNNGAVDANGDVILHVGKSDSTIQYIPNHFIFTLSLYDKLSTTDARWTSNSFTFSTYEFANDSPDVTISFPDQTYNFNPNKSNYGSTKVPTFLFNYASGKKPSDEYEAVYKKLVFNISIKKNNEDSDLNKYITFTPNLQSKTFGEIDWAYDNLVPTKDLYSYNGKYQIVISCYYNRSNSQSIVPIYCGTTSFTFNFQNSKPTDYTILWISLGSAAAIACALTFIIITVRRKKMLKALNAEEKEDGKEKPDISTTGF